MRTLLAATGGAGLKIALFAAFVLLTGLGSSWYLVGQGTRMTTNTIGSWVEWPSAGRDDADPYTRARIVRFGLLPLSGRIAATFEARFDGEGQRLHSSCEYAIRSQPLKASWWSIAVYDGNGLLIPNAAHRYGFDSSTIIARPDGGFSVSLAREARAGNWLPISGGGRLTLVLTMLQPDRSIDLGTNGGQEADRFDLPEIQRVQCR